MNLFADAATVAEPEGAWGAVAAGGNISSEYSSKVEKYFGVLWEESFRL